MAISEHGTLPPPRPCQHPGCDGVYGGGCIGGRPFCQTHYDNDGTQTDRYEATILNYHEFGWYTKEVDD